jgi:hypothetical protein
LFGWSILCRAISIIFENQVITFAQISRVFLGSHSRSVPLDYQYVICILNSSKLYLNLHATIWAKDIPWPRVRTIRHSLSF